MKRIVLGGAALAAVLAGGWYYASPGFALKGLRDAAISGNKQELKERVDFPAVRESLKEQVRAVIMAEMAKQKDNPFAGLGMLMAGAIIDPVIDTMVSPSGMKALVDQGKFKKPDQAEDASEGQPADWTIERDGIDHFSATLKSKDAGKAPTLIFRRDGMGWDLVEIEIPNGGLASDSGGRGN
ncbi:MAG: hypothetical protein RIQ99_1883 [Pseudomonadota bacterium]